MGKLELIGIVLLPLILCGMYIKPEILLYYLVIDSWLIIRISQLSIIHPEFTFNRIIVYLGLLIIIIKRLQSRSLFPKAAKSGLTVLVIIFLVYLNMSFISWTHEPNFLIANNLVFYFVALALLDQDLEKSFRHISVVAMIPVLLLSVSSMVSAVVHMDIGQRSYAGNRIQSAFYVILGLCLLFGYRKMVQDERIKRIAVTVVILIGAASVAISLGRMVMIICVVLTLYYVAKGYVRWWAVLVVILIACTFALVRLDLTMIYVNKLARLTERGGTKISEYNKDEMAAFTSGRSEAYKTAWRVIKKRPIWGVGYDWWARNPRNITGSSLHSRWIQILLECGIPGLLLYASLYALTALYLIGSKTVRGSPNRRPIRDSLLAAMTAFFLIGLTDNHGYTDRLFYLVLAMIATLRFSPPRSQPAVNS